MQTSRRKPFGRLMPKLKFFNCWARAWENRDRRKGNEIHTLALPKIRRVRSEYLSEHIVPIRLEGLWPLPSSSTGVQAAKFFGIEVVLIKEEGG